MFKNRQAAGRQLASAVQTALKSQKQPQRETIVVGLPRGGVPVAREVAFALNAPLTILVSKKIGAPFQPELACGAVSSSGTVVLNEELSDIYPSIDGYLKDEKQRLMELTKKLEDQWLKAAGKTSRPSFTGKQVIIVDDGVATGMTTLAALRTVKAEHPSSLILATPVIPEHTKNSLQNECDCLIYLLAPSEFWAIGQFYEDFHQIEDTEVVDSLKESTIQATAADKHSVTPKMPA